MISRGGVNFVNAKIILAAVSFIFFLQILSASPISKDLHLNIQTLSGGEVTTGTFDFVFNISNSTDCSNVVYSDSQTLTTDSRGIISHYLENVTMDQNIQYYLCHYRDGTLINNTQIAQVPYAFQAMNINSSGIIFDSDLNATGYTGVFSFLGRITNFITGLFVQDINLNGTLSGNGTINLSGPGDVCLEDGTCLSTITGELIEASFNASYFYNKTPVSYKGNFSSGGFVGYRAGHDICSQAFAGSHLCYESELMLTIDQGNISNITSWEGSAWIMTGGAKFSPADVPVNDCDGFTHGVADSYLGSFWIFNQTDGGSGGVGHCANEIPLACCKPGGIQ